MTSIFRTSGLIAAIGAILVALTGCGGDTATPDTAQTGATQPSTERITLGFASHSAGNTMINSIIAAADQAASDNNVELLTAATPAFDPTKQLQLVRDLFNRGAQGVATSVPGDSMANALNQFEADEKPIVQWNISSPRVNGIYVGEESVPAWKILGDKMLEELGGPSARGDVVIGTCAPGLPVLEARIQGVREGLAPAEGLRVVGPVLIPVDPVQNLATWRQTVGANADAVAFVGVCAPDLASMGKVNADNDDKYLMGGSDLTTENLTQIEQGHAFASIGQSTYVQGYLSIVILSELVRDKTSFPAGMMVPSGVQVVTKDAIEMPWDLPAVSLQELKELENDPAAAAEYYGPLFADGGRLADWRNETVPLTNALPE